MPRRAQTVASTAGARLRTRGERPDDETLGGAARRRLHHPGRGRHGGTSSALESFDGDAGPRSHPRPERGGTGSLLCGGPRRTGDLFNGYIGYMGDAFVDEWADTLGRLAELDFDTVVPGHGEPFKGKDAIAPVQARLRDLWSQARALRDAGVSPEDAAARIDLTARAARFPQLGEAGLRPSRGGAHLRRPRGAPEGSHARVASAGTGEAGRTRCAPRTPLLSWVAGWRPLRTDSAVQTREVLVSSAKTASSGTGGSRLSAGAGGVTRCGDSSPLGKPGCRGSSSCLFRRRCH
jgi:hypothetical protein